MSTSPTIHWFRQDLRVADNSALIAAAEQGPVIPVYILDDTLAGEWAMGGASRWWLHGSLVALDQTLRTRGSRLILRRGTTIDILMKLATETGAKAIHCTRAYEPCARIERQLKSACDGDRIELRRYPGSLLFEPETIRTQTGEPYRVFTPFWRALQANPPMRPPAAAPPKLAAPDQWPASEALESWKLRPTAPDWAHGLASMWTPGEKGADQRLTQLLAATLPHYSEGRDRPDQPGTSMLSPHLHFGELSPLQCWNAVDMAGQRDPRAANGAAAFLRELGWREFSYHLLHHWPAVSDQPFRPEFKGFPWLADTNESEARFDAWTRGETGYPIVDAGMRQLWETGWMHNRVRMIAASFLTKHLLVPWQSGARWFWDTLVDADLANNSAGWQWVAGSGADAAPYFRIFNPILQSQKFDPDGVYLRRYLPELRELPTNHIHAPWSAPATVLDLAGIELGKTYPKPLVDHAAARQAAMDAFSAMKNTRDTGTKSHH